MLVEIDKYSGFCFGVTKAISKAEELLKSNKELFCLGQIVHNKEEEDRLVKLGLKTLNHGNLNSFSNNNILIRAHGEPPETYKKARKNNLNVIDATCPVVLKLQKKIKETYLNHPDSKIVIYGKKGHAEVNGLVGQTENKAIVISNLKEAHNIDVGNSIFLFAQTTANHKDYNEVISYLKSKAESKYGKSNNIISFNTICPSVIKRIPYLEEFVKSKDLIIFVSDRESSNGNMLFAFCKKHNKNSFFVTNLQDVKKLDIDSNKTIGISGATSTPLWLMEDVKKYLINKYS